MLLSGRVSDFQEYFCLFFQGESLTYKSELNSNEIVNVVVNCFNEHYNGLLRKLIPDVFQFISTTKTKELRNFAKQLNDCARKAFQGYDQYFTVQMTSVLNAFGYVGIFIYWLLVRINFFISFDYYDYYDFSSLSLLFT